MHSNIETKKSPPRQWRWFVGLYVGSLLAYGIIELGVHYLNDLLIHL